MVNLQGFFAYVPSWVVGITLAVLSAFLCNLGINLQKYSHLHDNGAQESNKRWTKSKIWVIGLVLLGVGSIFDFCALAFAPQSLVAPLALLTLVSNMFLSYYLLNEVITKYDIIAAFHIISGCIIIVVFGPHNTTLKKTQSLFSLYHHQRFIMYIISIFGTIGITYYFVRKFNKILKNYGCHSPEYEKISRFHRFLYCAMAGSMGAQNILFAKAAADILMEIIIYQNAKYFFHIEMYITLVMLAITIYCQLRWLNEALEKFDCAYCIPVFEVFWVSLGVIGGLIMYKEAYYLNALQLVMFIIGLLISMIGILILASRPIYITSALHKIMNHGYINQDNENYIVEIENPVSTYVANIEESS